MGFRKLIKAVSLAVLGVAVAAFPAMAANVLTVVTTHEPPRLDPAEVVSYESGIVT